MGRDIRRVPPGWEHPRDGQGRYIPMYDQDYESAAAKWIEDFMVWQRGEHEAQTRTNPTSCRYYWEWSGNPPDEMSYRPKWEVEPTCYQIYESVSEGTPVSPVFETLDQLKDWLVEQGYSRDSAEQFAEWGHVPSAIFTGTQLLDGLTWAGEARRESKNI